MPYSRATCSGCSEHKLLARQAAESVQAGALSWCNTCLQAGIQVGLLAWLQCAEPTCSRALLTGSLQAACKCSRCAVKRC